MTLKERMDLTAADVLRELERLETEIRQVGVERQQILRALRHKKHGGTNVATKEQIIRHYCKGLPDYDRPLKELVQEDLLLCRGSLSQGPYVLNLDAKARIERILGPDQPAP